MKKTITILLWFLLLTNILLLTNNVSAVEVCPGTFYNVGNENYTVNACMNFSTITVTANNIQFNNTVFILSPTSQMWITLSYINTSTTNAADGDTLVRFSTVTNSNYVYFTINGLTPGRLCNIRRDGVFMTHTGVNPGGRISFSEYGFPNHTYTISYGNVQSSLPNATTYVNNLWNNTFRPYINRFGGMVFLIPVTFIGLALFVKTRDPMIVSMYLIVSGVLLSGGGIFVGAVGMIPIFIVITAIGIAGLFISIFFKG